MTELKEAPRPKTENGAGQLKEVAPRGEVTAQKWAGSPFLFMRRFAEEMDRLFEDFGMHAAWHMPRFFTRGHELLKHELGFTSAEWSPEVDIRERDGQFVVHADLPGLAKEDVKVEITDTLLTIQGERKQEKKEEREGYRYSERAFGTFYRAIPLPAGADGSKATAEFRNGVLEITMPSTAQLPQKTRRLEVREGK